MKLFIQHLRQVGVKEKSFSMEIQAILGQRSLQQSFIRQVGSVHMVCALASGGKRGDLIDMEKRQIGYFP